MKNKTDSLKINKDQLLTLRKFKFYCCDRSLNLKDDFFEALIKEGFLKPLYEENREKYFSPHQMAIVARLRNNTATESILRFPEAVCWEIIGSNQHEVRAVEWGGSGFVAERDFKTIFEWINVFQNFLMFIHSLTPLSFHQVPNDKQGGLRDSAQLCFDFSFLKEEKNAKLLNKFGLNVENLNWLRKGIGFFSYSIDPMQTWFYYLQRHPRWKKEELKGDARLSQELYSIDELIQNLMEVAYGNQKDLPSLLNEGSRIGQLSEEDYVIDTDFIAIEWAFQRLQRWLKSKSAAPYMTEEIIDYIGKFGNKLEDFKNKFGTEIPSEHNVKLSDLPSQYRMITIHDGNSSKYKENSNIWGAVSWYLRSIQGDFLHFMDFFRKQVSKEIQDCYEEQNTWNRYEEPEDRKKRMIQIRKKITELQTIEDELCEIMKSSRHLLCSDCRKNPVRQFDKFNATDNALCQTCIDKRKRLALSNNETLKGIFRKRKEGLWICDHCGTLLYKFTNKNTFISEGKNENMVVSTLNYGCIEMEVTCKGTEKIKCGYVNKRIFNFGWLK